MDVRLHRYRGHIMKGVLDRGLAWEYLELSIDLRNPKGTLKRNKPPTSLVDLCSHHVFIHSDSHYATSQKDHGI